MRLDEEFRQLPFDRRLPLTACGYITGRLKHLFLPCLALRAKTKYELYTIKVVKIHYFHNLWV